MKALRIALLLLSSLLPLSVLSSPAAQAANSAAKPASLTIETTDGRRMLFDIELAETPEQQEQGLMNRSSLPENAGMLFDFGTDRPVAMWMKNTLIPLDMVFIDRHGRITGIAARTVPMSLEIIPSPGPVRAVLEINGGIAEKLHIRTGDRVDYPVFQP